jgi:hypothetical protein
MNKGVFGRSIPASIAVNNRGAVRGSEEMEAILKERAGLLNNIRASRKIWLSTCHARTSHTLRMILRPRDSLLIRPQIDERLMDFFHWIVALGTGVRSQVAVGTLNDDPLIRDHLRRPAVLDFKNDM